MLLSNFALKSVSVCSFTKSVFQCRRGLVQMKWGLEQKYMHPSRYWNSRTYWSGLSTKKKYSCRCQILRSKECRYAVSRNVFFNLVKDFFKSNEGWSRSVSFLVGSEAEGFFRLGCLRGKYSCHCQLLRSKEWRYSVSRKVFFNLVKDLFKWNEGWSRSVSILIGSGAEGIIDLVVYEKSTHVVVKFCAQKSVGMQFHEKCFSM